MEMGEPVHDGAAAASSSSSSSSSSLSGAEEHAFEDQCRGHGARAPPAASVGQRTPRRLWAAARAGAPRLRQACDSAARDLVAWTRQGGAPRPLVVVSVSLESSTIQGRGMIGRSTVRPVAFFCGSLFDLIGFLWSVIRRSDPWRSQR